MANSKENTKPLEAAGQDRTKIQHKSEEKGSNRNESGVQICYPQNKFEVENALWEQKLQDSKLELAETKMENATLKQKVAELENENEMMQTTVEMLNEITEKQTNEIFQLKDRLEKLEHRKNGMTGDITNEVRNDVGQKSEDRKWCIKNENLLGNVQNMLAGYTNTYTGEILDDVSDALQRERERRRRETQPRIFESIDGDVSGKNVETSISDDMEEMIKLTKKQELLRNKYGIASNFSLLC